MNHHRIDLDGFQKHNVASDAIANLGIGRIHETAAVFHDKSRAAEPLNIRQRFEQRFGLGDSSCMIIILPTMPDRSRRPC